MARVSRGLADYEHDRCERERLFLPALFPATAAAARIDLRFRCATAERTSALENFVDSGTALQSAACPSSAENHLAVLV